MIDFNRDSRDENTSSFLRPYSQLSERASLFADVRQEQGRFLGGLYELGEEAVGKPFEYRCNPEANPPKYFSPHPSTERHVADLHEARDLYGSQLPIEARAALDTVVEEIGKYRSYPADGSRDQYITISYGSRYRDVPRIIGALKTLWDADPFIDPRLTHAEDLFYSARTRDLVGETESRGYSGPDGSERLLATLEWMAKPENADRVARMALYSGIVEHVPEENGRTAVFTEFLHERLKAGKAAEVAQRLAEDPDGYYQEVVRWKRPFLGEFRNAVAGTVPLLYQAHDQPRISQTATSDPQALAEAVPGILTDHARLLDGSWARMQARAVQAHIEKMAAPRITTGAGDEIIARGPSISVRFG